MSEKAFKNKAGLLFFKQIYKAPTRTFLRNGRVGTQFSLHGFRKTIFNHKPAQKYFLELLPRQALKLGGRGCLPVGFRKIFAAQNNTNAGIRGNAPRLKPWGGQNLGKRLFYPISNFAKRNGIGIKSPIGNRETTHSLNRKAHNKTKQNI
jgi:hypothetical protein